MQVRALFCFESSLYDTSMALVTLNKSLTLGNSKASFHYTRLIAIFCFGSIFGMVTVKMPSSTLAEI